MSAKWRCYYNYILIYGENSFFSWVNVQKWYSKAGSMTLFYKVFRDLDYLQLSTWPCLFLKNQSGTLVIKSMFQKWTERKEEGSKRGSLCWPRAPLVAQRLKHLPAMQETWVWSLGWEDPLEKEMATHSSILAWKIPWTEEPGRLYSTGQQRVGHDWVTSLFFLLCWPKVLARLLYSVH